MHPRRDYALPAARSPYRGAITAPETDGWMKVTEMVTENLRSHDVYKLVPRAHARPCALSDLGWALHHKFKYGVLEKNKARLVARGNPPAPRYRLQRVLGSFSPVLSCTLNPSAC